MGRRLPRLADPAAGDVPHGAAAPLSLGQLPDKGRVLCQGRVESVTFLPADQAAAFTAIVADPPAAKAPSGHAAPARGRLRVVWLGRRHVPGIEAGAELRLEGMISRSQGMPTMFNPRYEILSSQENE